MNKLKIVGIFLVCTVASAAVADSDSQEVVHAIMDCACSAIVENVSYSGNGDFTFSLRSFREGQSVTDQNKFGARTRIVLKFNADILGGTQIVLYPESQSITSETVGLSGTRFLNLLISRMQTQTPISLTFSVMPKENTDLENEQEFELRYFQINGQ